MKSKTNKDISIMSESMSLEMFTVRNKLLLFYRRLSVIYFHNLYKSFIVLVFVPLPFFLDELVCKKKKKSSRIGVFKLV